MIIGMIPAKMEGLGMITIVFVTLAMWEEIVFLNVHRIPIEYLNIHQIPDLA